MKVAVTGGKGGVGKSLIATALASELAKRYKVLLIDADVDCPNDHIILSIERTKEKDIFQPVPRFNLEKCRKCGICSKVCKENAIVFVKNRFPILIEEQCTGCSACMIACPFGAINKGKRKIGTIYSGTAKPNTLALVSGEMRIGNEESSPVVNATKAFASKTGSYEFTIVDTAAGTHCNVISALLGCDVAIAVTEPTPFAAHDLELILKLLKILKIKAKVVINKSTIGKRELIYKVVRRYKTEVIAEVPYKKSIARRYFNGKVVKDKAIEKIAKFVEGLNERSVLLGNKDK
ncbi:MAG TPA: 4Fe-4S dicluster domain-containing protein [Candidatus Aenigmarchaeota archaeon]|nr:MAG: P-loop ATPase [Candidatus Aenigmarchaeota archaeon]HDD46100.1 4Fe-4S dicluster domain-containing protein [Candidatus Aenigmarchaeota archaeon]